MAENTFETHSPVDLLVEIGKGSVEVSCTDTTESTVTVEGRDADRVAVEQNGDRISVVAPRQGGGFFGSDSSLHVRVVVPTSSSVTAKTGSADVAVKGTAGSVVMRTGSGDLSVDTLTGTSNVATGSGDVRVNDAQSALRVKSGSGDIGVGRTSDTLAISTGSGDVEIGVSAGATVVKTGSGGLHVGEAETDVAMSTGSGDFVIDQARSGKFSAKAASGDVRLGVPQGVPVWTDVSTVSGRIRSSLQGAGQPAEGQDHVEVRVTTVSGDIELVEVS